MQHLWKPLFRKQTRENDTCSVRNPSRTGSKPNGPSQKKIVSQGVHQSTPPRTKMKHHGTSNCTLGKRNLRTIMVLLPCKFSANNTVSLSFPPPSPTPSQPHMYTKKNSRRTESAVEGRCSLTSSKLLETVTPTSSPRRTPWKATKMGIWMKLVLWRFIFKD